MILKVLVINGVVTPINGVINLATGVLTLLIRVLSPFITSRGLPCTLDIPFPWKSKSTIEKNTVDGSEIRHPPAEVGSLSWSYWMFPKIVVPSNHPF